MQKNWGQQDISRVFRSLEKNEERAKQLLTWIQAVLSRDNVRDMLHKKEMITPQNFTMITCSILSKNV